MTGHLDMGGENNFTISLYLDMVGEINSLCLTRLRCWYVKATPYTELDG